MKPPPTLHAKSAWPYVTRSSGSGSRLIIPLSCVGALLILLVLAVQAPFNATSSTETITIKAAGCTTPQTSFILGDEVCAEITGAPLPVNGFRQRRLQWLAPDGSVARVTDVTTDPQTDSYTVPTEGVFS